MCVLNSFSVYFVCLFILNKHQIGPNHCLFLGVLQYLLCTVLCFSQIVQSQSNIILWEGFSGNDYWGQLI
jgi:hypothetical protein